MLKTARYWREKQAGIGKAIGTAAVGIPISLLIAKNIHSEYTNAEPQRDIREPLSSLSNRKDRMQSVRTAFQDQFQNFDVPDIDNEKTKIEVQRSMFPWKDNYSVDVTLVDQEGEPISDWFSYAGSVDKNKEGGYTGNIDYVFTREDMQRKGIGRNVENRMVDAFGELGASKARLMPAHDGPVVWAKKNFGYEISPDSKKTFLKAYENYTKEKGRPFKDLGDVPSDYPLDFLQKLKQYEPTFSNTYYEKPIQKTASYWIDKRAELNYPSDDDSKRNPYVRTAEGVAGLGMLGAARPRLDGTIKAFHGTTKENAADIEQNGLLANKGGTGAASKIGINNYVDASKDHVHLTRLPHLAKMYAEMQSPQFAGDLDTVSQHRRQQAAASAELQKMLEERGSIPANDPTYQSLKNQQLEANAKAQEAYRGMNKRILSNVLNPFSKGGEVIQARIPYTMYHRAIPDEDSGGYKPFAFKQTEDVPIEAIRGSEASIADRLKYYGAHLPEYIKSHPVRFGSGIALGAAGAGLTAHALQSTKEDESHV